MEHEFTMSALPPLAQAQLGPAGGTFQAVFSNGWKFPGRFFQWLEVFGTIFPMVGSFRHDFSNDWNFFFTVKPPNFELQISGF
jgi:hypothetical protein